MKRFFVTSAIVASSAFIGFSVLNHEAEAENQPPEAVASARVYDTITVRSSSLGGSIVLGGSVLPVKTVNLSAQMPGDVKFVAGQEGDSFKKGDLLVSLDTAALYAKRKQAESQYYSAQAGVRNAEQQYRRELVSPNSQANSMLGGAPDMFSMFSDPFRNMAGEGNPGYEKYSNLYQYQIGTETARNQVDQALAAIKELDENIINAHSYAPFDGVIVKKMVEVGDIIQPGMPLVTFANIDNLQIQVEVPNKLLNMLSTGQSLKARLDGSDQLVDVTVDRIYPSADAAGHTTTVKFKLADNSGARSGMYAEVMVADPAKAGSQAPVIPESAIIWRGSLPAVYKLTDAGQIKMRLVRIGERVGQGNVSVISGISVGDRILANPASNTRSSVQ